MTCQACYGHLNGERQQKACSKTKAQAEICKRAKVLQIFV